MARIDLRKFDDIRHLVRARLLSSEFHDLTKIVKKMSLQMSGKHIIWHFLLLMALLHGISHIP